MVTLDELQHLNGAELDKGIQTVWNEFKDMGKDVIPRINALDDLLTKHLKTLLPKTPPKTKQECLEAANTFNSKVQSNLADTGKQVEKNMSRYLDLLSDFEMVIDDSMARVEDRELVEAIDKELYQAFDDATEKHRAYSQRLVGLDKTYVYQNMEVCEHLQKWWKEEATSGLHLVKRRESREYLQDLRSRGFHIPSEIMSNIYAQASLETCVSLRQVNKAWYSVFQSCDIILASKVQQRNPFMHPGDGDLTSWQDCVLVFVARLKWEFCDVHKNIDHIQFPEKPPKRHIVIGTELEFNEKLPENFVSFFGDYPLEVAYCSPMETIHSETNQHFRLDHWTLEIKKVDQSYTVVSIGDDRNIIMKNGVRISLPGHMKPPQDRSEWRVHVGCNMVQINMNNGGTLIMPRDNPVYENGVPWLKHESCYEPGELCVVREDSSAKHHFVDFSSKQIVHYAQAYNAQPRAFYNGLVWFYLETKNALVPTFIDYQTPDKLYFKPERIICEAGVDNTFEQGYTPHGTAQFLVTGGKDADVHVIDLRTGEITLVTCPYGWKDQAIHQLGFVNGKFSARCISQESAFKYRDQMLEAMGLE